MGKKILFEKIVYGVFFCSTSGTGVSFIWRTLLGAADMVMDVGFPGTISA